jgi:hypothetical protein
VFIMVTSAFSATRMAMWLLAPSIVPSMAQTLSLYAMSIIVLPDEPQSPLSFFTINSKGMCRRRYPPWALASSMAMRQPWSIFLPSVSSWLLPPVATETVASIGPMKPIFTVFTSSGSGMLRPAPVYSICVRKWRLKGTTCRKGSTSRGVWA